MLNNEWLQKYLETVIKRIINISAVISFMFWTIGVIFETYTFSGSAFDVVLIISGVMSTLFLIIFPGYQDMSNVIKAENDITAKRRYFVQVFSTLYFFGLLWTWTGLITFLKEAIVESSTPYTIIPEIFGIIGILVLIFCPSEEHFV